MKEIPGFYFDEKLQRYFKIDGFISKKPVRKLSQRKTDIEYEKRLKCAKINNKTSKSFFFKLLQNAGITTKPCDLK